LLVAFQPAQGGLEIEVFFFHEYYRSLGSRTGAWVCVGQAFQADAE
jgi:hypothetical protein